MSASPIFLSVRVTNKQAHGIYYPLSWHSMIESYCKVTDSRRKPSWAVQWSHLELFWAWRNPQTAEEWEFFSTENMRKKKVRFSSLWAFWGAQPRLLRCEYLICLQQKSWYEPIYSFCWLLGKTMGSQLCSWTAPWQEQERAAESKDWSLCHHPNPTQVLKRLTHVYGSSCTF